MEPYTSMSSADKRPSEVPLQMMSATRGNCRRFSSRIGKKVSYIYENPEKAFDKKNAKSETRSANAVPQVNKEHVPAACDPSDTAQQTSNYAPPSPSNYLHSDTTLRPDEATISLFLAAVKPQDPEFTGAESAAVEYATSGWLKLG